MEFGKATFSLLGQLLQQLPNQLYSVGGYAKTWRRAINSLCNCGGIDMRKLLLPCSGGGDVLQADKPTPKIMWQRGLCLLSSKIRLNFTHFSCRVIWHIFTFMFPSKVVKMLCYRKSCGSTMMMPLATFPPRMLAPQLGQTPNEALGYTLPLSTSTRAGMGVRTLIGSLLFLPGLGHLPVH
jgi:hypothetical protein